jgi:hypothetical protein
MRELLQQIVADFSMLHIRPLLQEEPRVVRPADRKRECRECGSLARPHQCPFTDRAAGTVARLRLQPAASRSVTHHREADESLPSPSAAPRPPPPARSSPALRLTPPSLSASFSDSNMCKSWRRTKTCPRLDKGKPCGYTHPADLTLTTKQCNAFRDTGFCAQGELCRYPHLMPASSSPAPAPASSPTPPASVPTPSASAPSSTLPPFQAAVSDFTQQGQTGDAETGEVSSSQKQSAQQPMPSPASLTPPSTPNRSSRSSHAASSTAPASASKKRKLALDDYLQPTRGVPWHEMSEEEEEGDRGKATLQRTPSRKTSRAAAASPTPALPSSSLSLLSSPEPRPPIAASGRQLSARRSLFPQETTTGKVLQRSASTSSSSSAAAASSTARLARSSSTSRR